VSRMAELDRGIRSRVHIPPAELARLISPEKERSMYLHPNPLAREIFWQRLYAVYRLAEGVPEPHRARCLDLGGGTGVLARAAAHLFELYTIVDPDSDDARRVLDHAGVDNVEILPDDIFVHEPREPYGTVIAADVLEHFEDLPRIVEKVERLVAPGGRLIVSLPTENLLYRVGRVVLRKTKPADHYHASHEVIARLRKAGFAREAGGWMPRFGLPLPLFEIVRMRKAG
jgi:2-polyprenyl-3-methyl-5-hydroxy-6-metoxy-1,4-benzoquinol methylase